MSIIQAIAWGILQGLTEFIPVSSSGHLVLVPWLLGCQSPNLTFDLVVHLGTLVAVALYFRRDILGLLGGAWEIVRSRKIDTPEARLAVCILVSMIPAAILGYLFEDAIGRILGTPGIVSLLLLVTGGILMASEYVRHQESALAKMRYGDALIIGLAQSLALMPGISRSGATISAGLLRGLSREEAARFSFLMVLPVILGATAYELLGAASAGFEGAQALYLLAGFLAAFLSGYAALRFLLKYLQNHGLQPFAYYCWAFGLASLIIGLVR